MTIAGVNLIPETSIHEMVELAVEAERLLERDGLAQIAGELGVPAGSLGRGGGFGVACRHDRAILGGLRKSSGPPFM